MNNPQVDVRQYPFAIWDVSSEEVSGQMWTVLLVSHTSDVADSYSLLVPSSTLDVSELTNASGPASLTFDHVEGACDVGFNRRVVANLVIGFPDGTVLGTPAVRQS